MWRGLRRSMETRVRSESHGMILGLQRRRSRGGDAFFVLLGYLGGEMAYTLGLPLLFWFWGEASKSLLVIGAWMLAFYSGHFLKDLLQLPRPFTVCKEIEPLETHLSLEYGFPSTHAQAAFCVPLALALLEGEAAWPWSLVAALTFALLVSFSRLYIGVHSLLDVLAGAVLGLACAWLTLHYGHLLLAVSRAPWGPAYLLAGGVGLLWIYPVTPHDSPAYKDTVSIVSAGTGCFLGDWLVQYYGETAGALLPASWAGMLLRTTVGLVLLVVGHELMVKPLVWRLVAGSRGSKKDFALVVPYRYISYLGIGINAIFLAPAVFRAYGI